MILWSNEQNYCNFLTSSFPSLILYVLHIEITGKLSTSGYAITKLDGQGDYATQFSFQTQSAVSLGAYGNFVLINLPKFSGLWG